MIKPQEMLSSTENVSTAFLQFTKLYKNEGKILFVESYDDEKYYTYRTDRYSKLPCNYICCNGKKNVINLRKEISEHELYNNEKNLFLVDADFDDNSDLINEKDIYVTPTYAIENFYISDECFEKILQKEFQCKCYINEDEYKNVRSHYILSKKMFIEALSDFNYFIHSYRISKLDKGVQSLNLKGLDQKSDFIFEDSNLSEDYLLFKVDFNIDNINKTFPNITSENIEISKKSIGKSIQFLNENKEKRFRGKALLQFLIKYLNALKYDSNLKTPNIFSEQKKCSTEFSYKNAISTLSIYADTPDCLIKFIQNNCS